MLRLQITIEQVRRFQMHLRTAGAHEIGGVLVGEQLTENTFRLADFSVQHTGGSTTCFVRAPEQHAAFCDAFFARTGHQYTRFNYLGEWHSHPSFPALPSTTDVAAMQDMVEDAAQGLHFAVLLIVNLDCRHQLRMSGTAFRAHTPPVEVELISEGRILSRRPEESQPFGCHTLGDV